MSSYFSLAPYYDSLTEDVDYGAFLAFYETLFRRYGKTVKTVIDLACGTGTLTCLMAQKGYETIGIDASPEMLSVAESKGRVLPEAERPLFLCQELQELDLYGTSDAAVCCLDGMNYIPPEELDSVFSRLLFFLEPGGLFIFDINTPCKLQALDGEIFIDETEDVYCVWRAEFNECENVCQYGMDIFTRDGEKWDRSFEEHTEYAHSAQLLTEKLREAGYEDIRVFGELTEEAPGEEEQRLFITAVKPSMISEGM